MEKTATICAAVVKSTIESLVSVGADLREIEETLGISLEQLADPDERISMHLLVRLEHEVQRLARNPAIALHIGAKCLGDGSQSGIVGHVAAQSPTIGEGFRQAIRYSNLLSDVIHLELREGDEQAEFVYMRDNPAYFTIQGVELAFANTIATLRTLGGDEFDLLAVHFQYPVPGYLEEYHMVFGQVLHFDQLENKIVFPASILNHKSPYTQPYIKQVLTEHATKLLKSLVVHKPFSERVQDQIIQSLPWGPVSVDRVAANLDMSRQTLYRRLKAEGTTFQELLDHTRKKLATEYLRNKEYSTSEIAFLLGFSEHSSFYRAFRRWYGENPGEYRARLRRA